MADRKFGFETLCLHAGQIPDAVRVADIHHRPAANVLAIRDNRQHRPRIELEQCVVQEEEVAIANRNAVLTIHKLLDFKPKVVLVCRLSTTI